MTLPDSTLLQRAFDGDPEARRTLDKFLREYVTRLVPGLVRGAARLQPEDLVQITLLHLTESGYRQLRTWDPARGPAFLNACIRNKVSDALRSRDTNPRELPVADDAALWQRPSVSSSQEEARLKTERLELLEQTLNTLAPAERAFVRAAFLEERSAKELAQLTGQSPGAVAQHKSRMLKRLVDMIRKNFLSKDRN